MNIQEKAAYLKGLMDGSELKLGGKEQKIVDALMELVSDMAGKVTEIDDDLSNLYDGFDAVCDSLDEIEEDLDYLFDGEDAFDEDEDDDDDALYDVECPKCHKVTCIDEDTLLLGDISCPSCGEKLEFDVSCDCEACRDQEKEGE